MALMKPITRYCKQSALYWEPIDIERGGSYLFADPVEIKVRWEDAAGLVVSRTQGEWRPAVKLITPFLLKEYGLVRLGTLADLESLDPLNVQRMTDTLVIGAASQIPDIRSRRVLYQAFIGRL
jgi:hypothetical protein